MKTTEYKLSKKLKELGVEQDSYVTTHKTQLSDDLLPYAAQLGAMNNGVSAFTLCELLEMLPPSLLVEGRYYCLVIDKNPHTPDGTEYEVQYEAVEPYKHLVGYKHENAAEAAGLLLAECIKKGYIKTGGENENKLRN